MFDRLRKQRQNHRAQRLAKAMARRPSPLVVEMLEPRLLLSAGPLANQAGLGTIKAMHDNLANLASVMAGLDHTAPMTTSVQLVEIAGNTTVGTTFNLSAVFTQEVVAPLQGLSQLTGGDVPSNSTDLASALHDAIVSVIGSGAGKSVSVSDDSAGPPLALGITPTGTDPVLHVVIDDQQTFGFTLNLGDDGSTYGIKFADSVGQATLNYHFDLSFSASGLQGTDNPNASQVQSAFHLNAGSFTATFNASTNLAGQDFNLGILKLSVPTGTAVNLSESLALAGAWTATTGLDLASKAAAINGGDYSTLTATTPFMTNGITSQTSGPTLLDLPVSLLDSHTIDGITSFTGGHIVITAAHVSGTDLALDLTSLTAKLQTATGNPDLDLVGFNNFLVQDLIGKVDSLGTYLGKLASQSADLNLELPFLSGTGIGSVIDVASEFKTQFIDPLAAPAHEFGFNEGVGSAVGKTTLAGGFLSAEDITALPTDLAIKVSLDTGQTADLRFESAGINSVADLAAALNTAITGTAIDGYISAAAVVVPPTVVLGNTTSAGGTELVFSIIGSHGDKQPKRITISSPEMATDIRSLGVTVARLLHLSGWDDAASTARDDSLLSELGMAYDADHNGITFTIGKEITLPEVVAPLAIDFSLGDLAGLSLSNAQFHLTSSVLLSLTVGYSLDPIGTDVNKPGGPQIGDGQNGTTDTAITDIPVVAQAIGTDAANPSPVTADQIINDGGSHYDLQIIGREGLVKQFEITPGETLSNLETQIANGFHSHMTLSLDPDTGILTLTDTFNHPYSGPTPASLGFTVGSLAEAVQDTTNAAKYTTTLAGLAPSGADYASESQFILSLGTMTPVVVDVAAGANTASDYIARLNTALAGLSADPVALGLTAGTTLDYGDLVHAAADTNGIKLTTTIYDTLKAKLGEDPYLSTQRVAVQAGIRVDGIQLMASAMNGSMIPALLGLVGTDAAGESAPESVIHGVALHTETQADRFYLQNSGLSAIITAALEPVDPTQPVVLSGNFGAFGFNATLFDPNDVADSPDAQLAGTYISIKLSLMLNTPGADPGAHITIADLETAYTKGEFAKVWSLQLASGVEDQPFAQLDIKALTLTMGSVNLTSASSPSILVTVDGIENLLEHKAPDVHVEVTGLSKTLVAADLIGALQQSFDAMNSGVMQDQIPLIGVSLDDILGFGQTFLQALDAAQQNPDASLVQVQDSINSVLGANVLSLSIDGNHQLIAALNWSPVAVSKQLPFNLDLNALDAFLGGSDSTLAAVASTLGAVASLSADGNVQVNAHINLALTLGFDLNGQGSPALAATLLSGLNGGKGLRTDKAGNNDLQFTLGDGTQVTLNVGKLPKTASVADLVQAINDAGGAKLVAAYDPTTGTLTLTDSTTPSVATLGELGFTDGQVADDFGKVNKLVGSVALGSADYTKAYSFTLSIGANAHADVEVAADATRTTGIAFVEAVRAAMAEATMSSKVLLAENAKPPAAPADAATDYDVSLGQLVQVQQNAQGKLVFSATDGVLGTDGHGNLLNTLSIAGGTPKLSFKAASLNGSTIVQDLGLATSDSVTVQENGARVMTTKLLQQDTFGQRLYLETGLAPSSTVTNPVPLTGIIASLGISATNLNFNVALGPFSASINNGVAQLGADTGEVAAGSPGFKVGDPASGPATFEIMLNDNFAQGTHTDGKVTFADLSHLGEPGDTLGNLLRVTINAAVNVDLPAEVLGNSVGDINFQIGNLYNTTLVLGEPPRSTHFTFPDFSHLSIPNFLTDPETLLKGLDAFLGAISGPFAQQLYNLDVPLIGPALQGLGSFFGILHSDVIEHLISLLDAEKASHPGQPVSTEALVIRGLQDVLGMLGVPGDIYAYLDSTSKPTELGFVWTFDKTLFSGGVNLSSDLGIPGLGLKIDNGLANLDVSLHFTLAFGYKKNQGFFVYDLGSLSAIPDFTTNDSTTHIFSADLSKIHAIDLSVAVTLASNFTATLNLGFLTMVAVNGTMLSAVSGGTTYVGTSITGDIYLDVGPKDTDGRLLFSEFSKGSIIRAGADLLINVDLALTAGVGFGSLPVGLPTITTELTFQYLYVKTFFGAVGTEPTSGVQIPITFNDVSLDVGSLMNKVLLPVLDEIETVIGPLQPVIDFLQTPIPGLSVIMGPTSIMDLAKRFIPGPEVQKAVQFLSLIDTLNQLDRDLHASAGQTNKINFGTYVLGDLTASQKAAGSGSGFGGFGGFFSLSSFSFDPFSAKLPSFDFSLPRISLSGLSLPSLDFSLGGFGGSKSAASSAVSSTSSKWGFGLGSLMSLGIFDFPILHNPLGLLKLLMGIKIPLDLIEVHLPQFSFGFGKDIKFNFLIGPVPVQVDIYAAAGVTFNLAFGYDTTGIMEFIGDHNALDLLDGFYIDNTIGPQMVFWAKFGITGAVNLVLVKAGIGGEISAQIDFTLYDPNADGKVHFSEFIYELTHEPLHMFVIDGALNLRIYAFAWVGIDLFFGQITIFEASFDIINVTLLSFHYDYHAAHSTPNLATVDNTGRLTLNLGENADQQEVGGNISNPDQQMNVYQSGGTVHVVQNGIDQAYGGASSVNANLGDGNNKIHFTTPVDKPVTIVGGDGNNVIDLANVIADPLIDLGAGNNTISGSLAQANTVRGGNGNNIYRGGNAGDDISIGSGNNLIVGGSGDDLIILGGGDNTVYGGGGNDTIITGGGHNVIYGGTGNDIISVGAGDNIIFGNGPDSDTTSGGTSISGTLIAATPTGDTVGSNTIYAGGTHGIMEAGTPKDVFSGGGANTIFGGAGGNLITGGSGRSVIFGSYGQVSLDGAGGIVALTAAQSMGGNNSIQGGSGAEVILGGAGHNSIGGGGGSDIILAVTGTVDGAKGVGAPGSYTITSSAAGTGDSTVDGGSGNDVIMGGIGSDSLLGGTGSDTIFGDLGVLVRDRAVGDANLISAETSNESLGAGDTIIAGAGNDIVFGGKGADSIDIGNGSDVALGDFGTVTATRSGTALTVLGQDAGTADNGNDSITAAGSSIIMGGGGDNTILTTEHLLPADPATSTPALTPRDLSEVVFGAAGQVTADYALLGGFVLHQAGSVEMNNGGNNSITVGDGDNAVFGGPGTDRIRSGSGDLTYGIGNTVVLAHSGDINWSNGNTLLTAASRNGDPLAYRHGDDIIDGYGNTVVIGGGGNNTITTHDALSLQHGVGDWTEVVFGGNGNANLAYDSNGRIILLQGYTIAGEENFGGNNTIIVGDANDVVIGGAGTQHITAGGGDNILLGHLGSVDLTRQAAPDASGFTPDILSYTAPQDRSSQPTPSAFITAGGGNNVIMGGSGDNTILAGNGDNLIFGASGATTRDAAGTLLKTFTVEETLGGTEHIAAGQGSNTVFGGAGTTYITVGDGNNVVLGHIGTFTRMDGINPDVIGRETTLYGTIQPLQASPPQQVLTTVTTILAGDGNNVIQGSSAGNNVITAGIGNNIVFGAAGLVTRKATAGASGAFIPVFAETVEECIGGNNLITVGRHGSGFGASNVVFGGFGANTIIGGDGDNKVFGHSGAFNWWANGQPNQMLSRDWECGLDVTIVVGDGNNDVLGGHGNNSIRGGDGHNVMMSDHGLVQWNTDGTRFYAESQKDPGPTGNSTVQGGDGNNDIIGGPDRDLLIGGNGTNIIIGYNGQIFFDHGVEIRAQSYSPFIGLRHTLVGGTGHDFMIGGTLGNDVVGDPLNDLIFPEQGVFTLKNRIATWEQPPFVINGITNPIFNWFNTLAYYDALAGETHTTMNGDPSLLQYAGREQPVLSIMAPPLLFSLPGLQFSFGLGTALGTSPLFNGTLWLVSPEAGGTVVIVTGIGLSAVNTVLTPMWDWLPADGSAVGTPGGQQVAQAAVPTPVYLVEGDQTLPGGRDLSALAATVDARRQGAPQAWVLDEVSGRWLLDETAAEGPRLVQHDLPLLLPEEPAARLAVG